MKTLCIFLLTIGSLFASECKDHKKKGRVVLIHGIINHHSMSSLHKQFRRDGWDVENWTYQSTKKSIKDHGTDLAKRLSEISKEGYPTYYVAFSMGGLVLKAALNDENCPKEAKQGKIVLISSPINGSKVARLVDKIPIGRKILGKHAGMELRKTPAHGFTFGDFPESMPILVISGTFGSKLVFSERNDGAVGVSESCPNRPHEHIRIWAHHKWICQSPMLLDALTDFIETDRHICNCHV